MLTSSTRRVQTKLSNPTSSPKAGGTRLSTWGTATRKMSRGGQRWIPLLTLSTCSPLSGGLQGLIMRRGISGSTLTVPFFPISLLKPANSFPSRERRRTMSFRPIIKSTGSPPSPTKSILLFSWSSSNSCPHAPRTSISVKAAFAEFAVSIKNIEQKQDARNKDTEKLPNRSGPAQLPYTLLFFLWPHRKKCT